MDQPVTIKLQSTFNPTAGWNEQVPVVLLSNGEVAVTGFASHAIYSSSDLRTIADLLDNAAPEIASQLQQPMTGRQQFRQQGRQQIQQNMGLQQQQGGNIRSYLQSGQPGQQT